MSELHQERESSDSPDGNESYVYQYIEINVQPGAVLHLSAIKREPQHSKDVDDENSNEASPS